jgi:hypothetical protein
MDSIRFDDFVRFAFYKVIIVSNKYSNIWLVLDFATIYFKINQILKDKIEKQKGKNNLIEKKRKTE